MLGVVAEVQLMVDVASHYDIEWNIDENSVDENSEQKHQDIWCDFDCL